jgi:hypothetical protein
VSFYAKGKKSITSGSPIIFNEVPVNEGGGFDAATGVFTTPVPGTYIFTASFKCDKETSYAEVYIYANGSRYSSIYSKHSSAACSLSLQLKSDQEVWLQTWDNEDYINSDYLSFMGALVQPQLS